MIYQQCLLLLFVTLQYFVTKSNNLQGREVIE